MSSSLQVVLGNVHGNESSGFNAGTRRVITTKKDRQRSSGGGGGGGDRSGRGNEDGADDSRDHSRSAGGNARRDRPRISIKDKRDVSVSLAALGGTEGAAAAGISAEQLGSGLLEGTSLRRKVVDVRQRNSREAKLQSRREQEAQEKDVSSGFNTQGGQRRALIVLPKSQEKMQAREMLMQLHPHIAQVFRGLNPPDTFTQEPFSRVLGENAPLMPYRRRQMEVKTVVQWAERKLFLWELEFLTSFALRPGTVVVYADCAPGTRIPYLASLFPHVSFVCVDPASLDIDESASTNIAVKQESFSDALARQMRQEADATGKTVLFISSATAESPVGGLLAEEYSKDNGFSEAQLDAQKRFYLLLKPAKALLKFSLPWTDASTHYLDGDVYLGVWNGPTSTEARIVPNGFQRTWSHRHFEEQMMHFNNVSRVSLHEHGVTAEGIDGCYDCTSEVYILERYLERYPQMTSVALGSQLDAQPAVPQPAKQLRLDTTRFNDPKWIASRALRAARLQQAGAQPTLGSDGQPLTAEEQEAALQLAEHELEQAEMADQAAASSSSAAAAAAAAPSEGGMGDDPAAAAAAASSSSSASAHSLPPPRTAMEALKQSVGKFSQELSRRLTHNGQRTLATINNTVIKRAAFSRKNRL